MKSAQRKADRPTYSGARDALFRGAFEDCLAICDALPGSDVETDLLRARAYISLNRADRALDAVQRLSLRAESTDESLTARMLEGAALLKLGCQGGGGPMGGTSGGGGPVIDNGPPDPPIPPQLGCDPNAYRADPQCEVAIKPGFPSGTCRQSDLQESMGVGDSLGPVNKDNVETIRSVVDINQVNAATDIHIVNNQTVVGRWAAVGWIYLDNNGGLWFQKDPQAQWSLGLNFNINQYFGLTITPPPGQNPYYIANHPTTAPGGKDLQVTKCFSKGRGLVPGALSSPAGFPVT